MTEAHENALRAALRLLQRGFNDYGEEILAKNAEGVCTGALSLLRDGRGVAAMQEIRRALEAVE